MPLLLLVFIGVPLIEVALFVLIGEQIGLWATLATIVLTAIIGTALLRAQGLATLQRVQEELNRGGVPVEAVFDAACLLVAGALLLTPGFLTDFIGFLLFVPTVRRVFGSWLWRTLQRNAKVEVWSSSQTVRRDRSGRVIDAEFYTVEEDHEESMEENQGASRGAPQRPTLGQPKGDAR